MIPSIKGIGELWESSCRETWRSLQICKTRGFAFGGKGTGGPFQTHQRACCSLRGPVPHMARVGWEETQCRRAECLHTQAGCHWLFPAATTFLRQMLGVIRPWMCVLL